MADQTYWDDLNEGDEVTLTEAMSSQRLVVWAAASGDFYQIHYDDDFAKGNNLPDIIVHGALKGMLVGRLLDELCGDEGAIKQWDVSYRGMDVARHDFVVHGTVTKKYEDGGQHLLDLNVGVRTDEGNETTPGTATVTLPSR